MHLSLIIPAYNEERRISATLDRALKLIAQTQCRDGGWDYHAKSDERGHDLSLAVMQAKALRSAMDSGLEVPPAVVDLAIRLVAEDNLPYRTASWHLWRDHRVFVPFATIQNWVEAAGEKSGGAGRGSVSRPDPGKLQRLHRRG